MEDIPDTGGSKTDGLVLKGVLVVAFCSTFFPQLEILKTNIMTNMKILATHVVLNK
jgi:hypothetical protein